MRSKVVSGALVAALMLSMAPTAALADVLGGAGQASGAEAGVQQAAPREEAPEKPATIAITTIIEASDTISYTLEKADGSTYQGTAAVGTDANMDNFTDSYWDGSHWVFDIPLQVFETPEQYGLTVPAGFEGDYKLDAARSNAMVKFVYVDNAWVPATGAGATLVFVEEAAADPEPTVAFDINDVLDADNAVHYYASGSRKHATAITSIDNVVSVGEPVYSPDGYKPHWTVEVTLKTDGVTAADYGVPTGYLGQTDPAEWVVDESADNKVTTSFTLYEGSSRWDETTSGYALLHFVHEQQADPEPTVAFDVNDVLDVDNAVHYYASGSTKHATAITSIDNVASVGEPVYHAGGTKPYWTVEVTLKTEGVTAADYGVPTGYLGQTDPAEWVVDEDADNDLTTSFTLREGQSAWRATTSGYALLHFVHEQAPEFDINEELNTYGTVTYDLVHTDGTSSKDNGTTIRSVGNVAEVGEAYLDADGNWAIDVTLKGESTPDDYNVSNWQLHDDEYELDADASKLTMTFRTNGVDGATWYCSGSDRANLVFVGRAAEPSVAFDLDAALAAYHTVHYTATTQTIENSTSIGKAGNVESVGGPVYDEAADRWTVEVTLKAEGVTAADYGVLEGFLGSDPAGWVIDPTADNDLTVTFALESGSDAWAMADGGYALLHFIERADPEPSTPEFDINEELNTVGTVSYEIRNADGSTYDDGGFGAILSSDNVESVGTPYQSEDGSWAIDVTLKGDATPADYGVDDWKLGDGEYSLDASSDLTLTFRTLGADGTVWYCSGSDQASLVFVEKADGQLPSGEDQQKPGNDDQQKPGNDDQQKPGDDDQQKPGSDDQQQADDDQQTPGDEDQQKPGNDDQQQTDDDQQSDNAEEDSKPADDPKAPGASADRTSEDGIPATGDSTSVAFAGVAAAGIATLVAGLALERRRSTGR